MGVVTPLRFPEVPQSSQPESLGFPSNTPSPFSHPLKNLKNPIAFCQADRPKVKQLTDELLQIKCHALWVRRSLEAQQKKTTGVMFFGPGKSVPKFWMMSSFDVDALS